MAFRERYRVVLTDTESLSGIAPVCGAASHPRLDDEPAVGVFDCCPTPVIETWSEEKAADLAWLLNRGADVVNEAEAERLAMLRDCPKSWDRSGLHCEHYREGDGNCCRCGRTNWMPEGGF